MECVFNWVRAVLWKTSLVATCIMNYKVQVTFKREAVIVQLEKSIGVWPSSSGLGFVMPIKYKVDGGSGRGRISKGFVETCLMQLVPT